MLFNDPIRESIENVNLGEFLCVNFLIEGWFYIQSKVQIQTIFLRGNKGQSLNFFYLAFCTPVKEGFSSSNYHTFADCCAFVK